MVRKVRRQIKITWFVLPLLMMISVSGLFVLKRTQNDVQHYTKIPTVTLESTSVAALRHSTKSLAELEPMDALNPYFLFFNRVPNCGSEILILLLQELQGWNSFKHVRLKDKNRKKLNLLEQEKLVYEVTSALKKFAVPITFDVPVYFVNFTEFDKQSPTYFNMIRDPIEKLVSRYYYKSKSKTMTFKSIEECIEEKHDECIDLSIPYFCGQDERCRLLNDQWALETAKTNVDKYFPVIGVLDELNATIEVFENVMPYFFKGAQKLYQKDLIKHRGNKNKKVHQISTSTSNYFKKLLTTEYEFYEWIKKRLFKQLQILYGDHRSSH